MSVNKVIILGNLGRDPDPRHTGTGTAVCELAVATTRKWKGKDGKMAEETEWHRIVLWGVQAENAAKYLAKGRQVYVEGRLKTESYDKDGQKHYSTKIQADVVQFLGGGQKGDAAGAGGYGGGGGGGYSRKGEDKSGGQKSDAYSDYGRDSYDPGDHGDDIPF